jgi:hypothetical protein
MFEKKVLRIFGLKRDEATGRCRKLHNEDLRDLYSSPSMIRMIRSKRIKLARHVARMKKKKVTRVAYWWGNQRERDH